MRSRRTLTTRLVGAIVLVAVVVLGLSFATTYVLVRRELQANALSNLQSRTTELQPLVTSFDGHPWNWAAHEAGERTPRKNETSRWNAGKDLSFVPLRPERVVEVRYDHMEGRRFRHTAQFNRWRPDRDPLSCTYAQLEQPLTFSLGDIVPGLGNAEYS